MSRLKRGFSGTTAEAASAVASGTGREEEVGGGGRKSAAWLIIAVYRLPGNAAIA